jgi:hypothetical protein
MARNTEGYKHKFSYKEYWLNAEREAQQIYNMLRLGRIDDAMELLEKNFEIDTQGFY